MHRTNATGQLRQLKERMSRRNLEKRSERIKARKTISRELMEAVAINRGMIIQATAPLRRGFFGRLKWALLGW